MKGKTSTLTDPTLIWLCFDTGITHSAAGFHRRAFANIRSSGISSKDLTKCCRASSSNDGIISHKCEWVFSVLWAKVMWTCPLSQGTERAGMSWCVVSRVLPGMGHQKRRRGCGIWIACFIKNINLQVLLRLTMFASCSMDIALRLPWTSLSRNWPDNDSSKLKEKLCRFMTIDVDSAFKLYSIGSRCIVGSFVSEGWNWSRYRTIFDFLSGGNMQLFTIGDSIRRVSCRLPARTDLPYSTLLDINWVLKSEKLASLRKWGIRRFPSMLKQHGRLNQRYGSNIVGRMVRSSTINAVSINEDYY